MFQVRRCVETRVPLAVLSAIAVVMGMVGPAPSVAQQATSLNGPPVQVEPMYSEPGVPRIIYNAGTPNPFAGAGGAGTGSGGGSTGGGGGGSAAPSDALNTLLGRSWGAAAIENAQSLGLNPSALAATCVMESGCVQPVSSGSGAQGVFQMYPAAFHDGLATALAANPALASQIVQGPNGVNDPTTAAIAASGYLIQADKALQNAGLSNPTVLDTRTYYQFGPTYGPKVAIADGSTTLGTLVPEGWLARNGLNSGTTVAQWQATITAKVGTAASQTVRT